MKEDLSKILPLSRKLNRDDLHHFIKSIKYINLIMNIDADGDIDQDDSVEHVATKVISDITVISDRTSQPPLLCLAQYFGVEDDLQGGLRIIQPAIIYLFDFTLHSWRVFDRRSSGDIYSSYIDQVLNEFKDCIKENSLNDVFSNMADEVIENIIKRIEY
jgi:hypothetical protein